MINLKKKLVFLHLCKTGGSSIRVAITGNRELGIHGRVIHKAYLRDRKGVVGDWHFPGLVGHITYKNACKFIREQGMNPGEFYFFTVVRNPFDAQVSRYNYDKKIRMIPQDQTFQQFIRSARGVRVVRPGHYSFAVGEKVEIDKIIQYEDIDVGWAEVASMFGYDPVLEVMNTARKEDTKGKSSYRDYYLSQEDIDIVASVPSAAYDIHKFGYEF